MPRIARLVVFAFVALLFFGLPSAVTLYTDWLWYGETGYRQIFTTSLGTRLLLGTATFLVTLGWLLLNLRLALASLRFAGPILWTGQQGVQIELPGKRQLGRLAIAAAAIVALPAGLYGGSQWLTFLSWRHAVPFGSADAVLGYDVAFYLFTLPFVEFVRGALTLLVVLAALGAGAVYALSGGVGLSPTGGVLLTRPAAGGGATPRLPKNGCSGMMMPGANSAVIVFRSIGMILAGPGLQFSRRNPWQPL